MNDGKAFMTTTFQLSKTLHKHMRLICLLNNVSMGCFVRSAIIDKIKQMENKK